MRVALISSVRVPGVNTFGWKWQAEDGTARCSDIFKYFHDCAEDAKKHGFDPHFAGTAADPTTASGTPHGTPGESASR